MNDGEKSSVFDVIWHWFKNHNNMSIYIGREASKVQQ